MAGMESVRIRAAGSTRTDAHAWSGGQFLQTDPMGYDDGPNFYAHVGNDPVNKVDPTGSDDLLVIGHRLVASWSVPSFELSFWPGVLTPQERREPDFDPTEDISVTAIKKKPRAIWPQKQQQKSVSECLLASAKKNGVSLALDAAGALIPGASTASTLGKLGVGAAAMVNSAVTANRSQPGGFVASLSLGIADFHLSSAAPLVHQYSNVSNVAKAIPFVGNLVSLTAAGLDAYNAYNDYQDCRAGK